MTSVYKGRRLEICFVNEKELDSWREAAGDRPVAQWVREVVGNHLAEDQSFREGAERDSIQLREQNRTLKRDLQKTEAALQLAESELIRVKHGAFLEDNFYAPLSEPLLDLLRSGCAWSGREILRELHINPNDTEAVHVISNQLEILAKMGIIKESPEGWRWIIKE